MSVDITIRGNYDFCRTYGLSKMKWDPCFCSDDGTSQSADPICPFCKGRGGSYRESFPFVLNLANANFRTLWSALGIDPNEEELTGSIDARNLLKALARFAPERAVRATRSTSSAVYCGLSWPAVEMRISAISEIADEAARREEPVTWA
jgi:hypothetical protein